MDIPNLSQTQTVTRTRVSNNRLNPVVIIVMIGLISGFLLSRISSTKKSSTSIVDSSGDKQEVIANIDSAESIVVGKWYGNANAEYKDSAIGTIEKGSINGEGTHILAREGGVTQRASLTSSAVDLDLFVGKKVEVKGQTNASKKTSWLLDVGTIKVTE